MIEIDIRDINNNAKGKMGLAEMVFNNEASEALVHSAVVNYLANQRQGTAATKTKGMVSGGGKKPWKQKSTGRARSGSSRSPIWRGGGTIFGPQPRDYTSKLPKNMRRMALYKALTMKMADGEVTVIDSLSLEKPVTKDMIKILKNLGVSDRTVLIVLSEKDDNVILSARNIPGVEVVRVSDINAYNIVVFKNIIFTADAMAKLQEGISEGEVEAS